MKGVKFSERITIHCSPAAAFNYTQDYRNRLKWDSFLIKAELMDGATTAGKGVRAYCVAKTGLGMVTEYVTFNRPKATAIKMIKGPYLFKTFLGSWTFNETAGLQTEVVFLYSFTLRFPFSLATGLIKLNLKRIVHRRLTDLKTHLESTVAHH